VHNRTDLLVEETAVVWFVGMTEWPGRNSAVPASAERHSNVGMFPRPVVMGGARRGSLRLYDSNSRSRSNHGR
jgi:hypothetical protein